MKILLVWFAFLIILGCESSTTPAPVAFLKPFQPSSQQKVMTIGDFNNQYFINFGNLPTNNNGYFYDIKITNNASPTDVLEIMGNSDCQNANDSTAGPYYCADPFQNQSDLISRNGGTYTFEVELFQNNNPPVYFASYVFDDIEFDILDNRGFLKVFSILDLEATDNYFNSSFALQNDIAIFDELAPYGDLASSVGPNYAYANNADTFDGQGHTISQVGIVVRDAAHQFGIGLFSTISGTITNLNIALDPAGIYGVGGMGILSSQMTAGTVSKIGIDLGRGNISINATALNAFLTFSGTNAIAQSPVSSNIGILLGAVTFSGTPITISDIRITGNGNIITAGTPVVVDLGNGDITIGATNVGGLVGVITNVSSPVVPNNITISGISISSTNAANPLKIKGFGTVGCLIGNNSAGITTGAATLLNLERIIANGTSIGC